jgi:glycosyltransferase involved in cell wall biosynthesis
MDGPSSGRLRVLWLIKGLGAGGAERLVCLAATTRDERAIEAHVAYLLPWKDALAGELERADVPVTCLEGRHEWDLRWALRLRRLIVRTRPDVIHVHSPYVAGIARLVARSFLPGRRPRIVYTEHLPWSGYVLPTRLLNALTYPLDDAHIAVSEGVRRSVPALLAGRLETVVHGIDLQRMREGAGHRGQARDELGIGGEDVLVGTIGNLRPQKRYPDLLRAARLVIDAEATVRFAVAGVVPPESDVVELHAELGLGDAFRFLGYVEDTASFLAACDLFVLASGFEGLPVSMMEALAVGVPVVATDVPGIRDELREGEEGLLAPVGRPDQLARTILSLVHDPRRREMMSARAREGASRFDITTATRHIERMYRQMTTTR